MSITSPVIAAHEATLFILGEPVSVNSFTGGTFEDDATLIVVGVDAPHALVGVLTRGDILSAHRYRLKGAREGGRHIRFRETIRRYTS